MKISYCLNFSSLNKRAETERNLNRNQLLVTFTSKEIATSCNHLQPPAHITQSIASPSYQSSCSRCMDMGWFDCRRCSVPLKLIHIEYDVLLKARTRASYRLNQWRSVCQRCWYLFSQIYTVSRSSVKVISILLHSLILSSMNHLTAWRFALA